MTREQRLELLKQIEKDIYIPSMESTFLEDAKSCAIHSVIEELEQEPKWISCSERLPEPNRLVLCYITTGATKTYFLALRNEYYDDWEEGVGGSRLLGKDLGYKVLAWMPLPSSYERGADV